jgi:ABC-type multidrug transport system ATPase subunit
LITLTDVYFRYSEDFVLKACSIVLKSTATSVIVGPNCSGKSTLLDIISTFKEPVSGRMQINGINPFSSQKALNTLRKLLSYMPATLVFPGRFKVAEIFAMFAGDRVDRELIRFFSIDEYMEKRYMELSDGMRTRVNIAVTFCKAPIVLLDEPMRSQDDSLIRLFPEFINRFAIGKTLIIASPVNIEGINNADIYKLVDGRLK